MSYFELYQKDPGLFFVIILISIVLTILVYGAFPIIFAITRKKQITKKKYKRLCYIINAIGMLFFMVINGGSSGAPYFLWTWVFSRRGAKILESKGLFDEKTDDITKDNQVCLDNEPIDDDISPDEALNTILKIQAQNTVAAMEENSQTQPDNESDIDFGLVPEKPIYTLAFQSVNGELEYLNNLYTIDGQKIEYNRRNSMSVDGISGMIDVYDTFLPSGQPYKTIYINMYGATKSVKAPDGFVLNNTSAKIKPEPKKEKPVKITFCIRCGSMIDSETKKCTGCGKQYFKWFKIKLNKFTITVAIMSLVIVGVSGFSVWQYLNILDLKQDVIYKSTTISRLESQIDSLEVENQKNKRKLNFFDSYAEILPSDNSNTYHKYGCYKMNNNVKFRIFNSTAAENNYYKCPYCH